MATSLQEAATCSICLECFTDPVSLDCGHSFCRPCITRHLQGAGAEPRCPQCRAPGRNLRPNRELGCIAELMKLKVPLPEELCQRHQQRLQLFCAEDHTLLCLVCREAREHKPHTVSPLEEAAQGFRDALQSHLRQLSSDLQGLEQRRTRERQRASQLEKNFQKQTGRVHRIFENLKELLEQEKQQLLSKLHQEHAEKLKEIQRPLTHLEEHVTARRDLVAAIGRKCEQQDAELLRDVQLILSRCDHVKAPEREGDSEMGREDPKSLQQQDPVQEKIMEMRKTFTAELEWAYMKGFEREVTLDPDSAHRMLILAEGGRSVRDGSREQNLPDLPERFRTKRAVLGKQRLSSGRHYWEVEVGDATDWQLGVCDETVERKMVSTTTPENGYWVALHIRSGYYALTSPATRLTPRVPPRVLGLFLDYEAGRLSVYNAQDRSLLFTFTECPFPHTLRPLFYPEYCKDGNPVAVMRILPAAGQK